MLRVEGYDPDARRTAEPRRAWRGGMRPGGDSAGKEAEDGNGVEALDAGDDASVEAERGDR